MTPGQIFLLVLLALYLSDCFLLVPRRGFGFISLTGKRGWRPVFPSAALGNDRGGLVMAMPLPPLGRAYVTGFWPISLTLDGFSALVTTCVNPGTRPAAPRVFIRWEDLETVGWESRNLLVNGETFLKLPTPEVAREYTRLLLRLAKLPRDERAVQIRRWCTRQLSADRLRRRLSIFEKATAGLRQTCNLLFFATFFAVPVTYWRLGFSWTFLIAVSLVFVLVVIIGIEFWCLHKKLYPEQKAERFQLCLLVGVMPHYAMRAVDELSKGFLGCAHPLAVGEALLDDERILKFRDRIIRDLRHPVPPLSHGAGDATAWDAAKLFREQFEFPAVRKVEARRVVTEVISTPDKDQLEPESERFCPRCLMPYESTGEKCVDCGGVETLALGS